MEDNRGWTLDAPTLALRSVILPEVRKALRSTQKIDDLTESLVAAITERFVYAFIKPEYGEAKCRAVLKPGGVVELYWSDMEGPEIYTREEFLEMYTQADYQGILDSTAAEAFGLGMAHFAIIEAEEERDAELRNRSKYQN